jgi:hypothetical protein
MHEDGILDGARRSAFDKEKIPVYPFDKSARYLVVWDM